MIAILLLLQLAFAGAFVAKVRPDQGACDPALRPRNITESGTQINSPNYPANYPPNSVCEWRFIGNQTNPEIGAAIIFAEFTTEDTIGCMHDAVHVYDGLDANAPILGSFCGGTNPRAVGGTGANLFVRFVSDGTVEFPGFRGALGFLETNPACGETKPDILDQPTGTFTSPNHPGAYRNNLDCAWRIDANPGQRIQITTTSFSLESGCCGCDTLEFHDGPTSTSPSLGIFCANQVPPVITSTANQVYVVLITDFSVVSSGFSANYMVI